MEKALADIEVIKGDAEREWVYSHRQFVEPMLDYIIKDFERSRIIHDDSTIGGMVICDSSEQAKEMFRIFETRSVVKDNPNKVKLTALILHDVGTKEAASHQQRTIPQARGGGGEDDHSQGVRSFHLCR